MATGHDGLVRTVADALRTLPGASVYADLPGEKPYKLTATAKLLLSAYVPTRATFANFAAMSPSDIDWHVPDVVVEVGGRRVAIDVCGWRESNARSARKIENVIAASRGCNIVGAVLVHEQPARKGFTNSADRDDQLDRAMLTLHNTMTALSGSGAPYDASPRPAEALRVIWNMAPASAGLGCVRWDQLADVTAAGEGWASEVKLTVERFLRQDGPLLTG